MRARLLVLTVVLAGALFPAAGGPAAAHGGTSGADGAASLPHELPAPRAHAAAVWNGTHAFVFGGTAPNGTATDEIVRYDPATGRADVVGRLPTPARRVPAVWTGTHAFLFGAESGDAQYRILRFDPRDASVTTMAARLPKGAYRAAAAWDGTHAYILGGQHGPETLDQVVRYDPAADVAETLAWTLPKRMSQLAAARNGTELLLFAPNEVYRVAPAAGTVEAVGVPTFVNPQSPNALHDGTHVWLLGATSSYFGWTYLGEGTPKAFRYDPRTRTSSTFDAAVPAAGPAAVWTGSRLLALGGAGSGEVPTASIAALDPAPLRTRPDLVVGMRASIPYRSDAATEAQGGAIYLFGGRTTSSTYLDTIVRYRPASDVAETLGTKLPAPRAHMASVVVGPWIYLLGGNGANGTALRDILRFDPLTGGLETLATKLPEGVTGAEAVVHGGSVYVLGGGPAVFRFEPVAGVATKMQATLPRSGALAVALQGDRILVFAGQVGTTPPALEYDPVGDKVYESRTIGVVTPRSAIVPVGGTAYVLGGNRCFCRSPVPAEERDGVIAAYRLAPEGLELVRERLPFPVLSSPAAAIGHHVYLLGTDQWPGTSALPHVLRIDLGNATRLPWKPDLAGRWAPVPVRTSEGETVTIVGTAGQHGAPVGELAEHVARVTLDGTFLADVSSRPGATWPTWVAVPGRHVVRIEWDATRTIDELDETNNVQEIVYEVASFCALPGPDAHGYTCRRVPYAPVDLAGKGTRLVLGDEDARALELPFEFPFYGATHRRVHVASNGFVAFANASARFAGTSLPDAAEPNGLVAAWWEDLDPSRGGTVETLVTTIEGRRALVVAFANVPHCCAALTPVSFQLLLFEDGVVRVLYQNARSDGGLHAAGLESPTGASGLRLALARFEIAAQGVEYRPPPSVDLAPDDPVATGSLAAGGTTTFQAKVLNRGTTAAGPFRVRFLVDGASIGERLVPGLAPWTPFVLESDAWTATPGERTAAVVVDPLGQVAESNETNNERTAHLNVAAPPAPEPNVAPRAAISPLPAEIVAGRPVGFGEASVDPDGTVVAWSWEFGDGGTSADRAPTHTYAEPGTYTARLTVLDDGGASAFAEAEVVVRPPPPEPAPEAPPADPAPPPHDPPANDTARPRPNAPPIVALAPPADQVHVATVVPFAAAAFDPDGAVVAWRWRFGDGVETDARAPAHAFRAPGVYTVEVTVWDDAGANATATTEVRVLPRPNAPPTVVLALPPTIGVGEEVVLRAASADPDGVVVGWGWDFGDGTTSTTEAPTHDYAKPGTYTVTVTVRDDRNATAAATRSIEVRAAPEPEAGGAPPPPAPTPLPLLAVPSLLAAAGARRRR